MSIPDFTSNFINRLEESHFRLDEFVQTNKKKADSAIADLKKAEADEQQNIDSLLRQLHSLQYERGVAESSKMDDGKSNNAKGGVAEQRQKLENKQVELEQEVSTIKRKNRVEEAQLDEVLAEEASIRRKADEVRAKKEEIEMARGITVEDLTKGLLNYRFTGLTFEQGKRGALSFKFTKLDREDQSRPFTFTLSMDKNNDYELSDVNPSLDQIRTDPILNGLNSDGKNGFNSFVVGMRKLFKETMH